MKGFYHSLGPVFLATLLTLGGCREQKSPDVLSKADMVRVLTELYLTEDKINRLTLGPDSSRKVFKAMKPKIEKKTGIPDSVFLRSFDYYSARPLEMEKIYAALVDSLALKEQKTMESQ